MRLSRIQNVQLSRIQNVQFGDGLVPQRPYTGTRRHAHAPSTTPPTPQAGQRHCSTHNQSARTTCKRLRRPASACRAFGPHAMGYVSRRPQSQPCEAHRLPPCPRRTLKQRGVRHCRARGHHRPGTPVPTHQKAHAFVALSCTTQKARPLGANTTTFSLTDITTLPSHSSSP